MELGSSEHKQLLLKSIIKTSLKIITTGLFLGVLLMIPIVFRDNAFSTGLFYAGSLIVLGSLLYGVLLGYKKYHKIIRPFHQQHPNDNNS